MYRVLYGGVNLLNRIRDNIFWIILVTFVFYIVISSVFEGYVITPLLLTLGYKFDVSAGMNFVLDMYTGTIASVIILFILCRIFPKNRSIWSTFTLKDSGNTWKKLFIGLGLGFLTNFICIIIALCHGDLKFSFDASIKMLPLMSFALFSVFIQSSSEEMWCRGFMYERLNVRYPLWLAIVVNGSIFGLLHIFNEGVTVLAIADIIICGISYSLLRWYTRSMWVAMGIHTMWNFTQNFIFGLPNSGLVSEVSIFRLNAVNGISNLIYDYKFGIEGAVPAVAVDMLLGITIIYSAKCDGRLRELLSKNQPVEI